MTDPVPVRPEPDVLPPEPGGALSVPPPVPQKKPGFLRRLFTSRKKQQAVAMQNGYLEMVDLIRAIRSHLDRQENVQTSVLTMLEKVPGAMDRQHEVMTMFKQQLENGMENNRRLTDSMGNLNNTLSAMDESQRASVAHRHRPDPPFARIRTAAARGDAPRRAPHDHPAGGLLPAGDRHGLLCRPLAGPRGADPAPEAAPAAARRRGRARRAARGRRKNRRRTSRQGILRAGTRARRKGGGRGSDPGEKGKNQGQGQIQGQDRAAACTQPETAAAPVEPPPPARLRLASPT